MPPATTSQQLLNLDSIVVQSDELLAAEIDDELVLLSVAQGNYYGLGETGLEIWRRLKEPSRVADLCADLAAEFDAAPEQIETETQAFLEQLAREGLILAK